MLKVLVIDDEPIVRDGLKTIIDWEGYGCTICGEGIDGRDGLNKILTLKPDLVLIDLKMPGIYGIDVIKEAQENGFKGKVVILTGYSDFSYAQSAIRLGVRSYLLKPIDEDELIEIVKKMHDEIQMENRAQKAINESKRHSKESLIKKIIMREETVLRLYDEVQAYGLNFNYSCFQVALIDMQDIEKYSFSRNTFYEHVSEFLADISGADMFLIDDRIGIILKGTETNISVRILKKLWSHLNSKAGEANIFITLGRLVEGIDKAFESYIDAKKLLERRFLYGDLDVVWYEENGASSVNEKIKRIDVDSLYTFIEIGDIDKIDYLFQETEKLFKKSELSTEKIKGLCVSCFTELKEKVILNYENSKNQIPSNEEVIHKIYEKSNLHILLGYLKEEFICISKVICNTNSDNTMKRIVNYIEKNYYKDLKLELLADIFCYNSSYLGKMFRNYTGESFNSYLDKVRIENAKQLLHNNLKVYQVSEKVGYKSIDYFYSKFKKYVGVSPKEFKKQ